MKNKYTFRVIWSEEDQEFVGLCAEFPSLSWLNKSQLAAFKGIRDLVEEVLDDLKKTNETPPEPIGQKSFSGRFVVRVPPEVHRKLYLDAKEAHVSLNRHISAKLAG